MIALGEKFGEWTVIADSGKRTAHREIIWQCKCTCGTIRNVKTKILRNESKPRSCGCSRKKSAERWFHSQYSRGDGCWEWKGTLNQGGYGKFRSISASRVAWIYANGPISKGQQVCHSCDNRKCVNPDHLFLGSIADNMQDKVAKNRQAKGSKIGVSILNEQMVLDIRKMRISGCEFEEIAKTFNISWWLVRSLCKDRHWKHVPLGDESSAVKHIRKPPKGSAQWKAKLTEEKVTEIKKMLAEGMIVKTIAEKMNISLSAIYDIKQGRTWTHC